MKILAIKMDPFNNDTAHHKKMNKENYYKYQLILAIKLTLDRAEQSQLI